MNAIEITMFKVLVKLDAIDTHYPNGWSGFADAWEYPVEERPENRLVSLTAMSAQDLESHTQILTDNNLISGEHFGVADQSAGAIVTCTGITVEEQLIPWREGAHAWFAHLAE